jgi:hypothetical protein
MYTHTHTLSLSLPGTNTQPTNRTQSTHPLSRRALVRFDLKPIQDYLVRNPNDTVLDATLSLTLEKAHASDSGLIVDLFPLVERWGAANEVVDPSENGRGIPARNGDVTWLWSFFNFTRWSSPGGAFNNVASATQVRTR